MGRFCFAVRVWIVVVLFAFWLGLYRGFSLTISITATGDNYLYYYDWKDGFWKKLDKDKYDSWKKSSSVDIVDFNGGYDYLVFAVKNKGTGSSGNGSGLLVQIDISNGIQILSDDSWEVYHIANGWDEMPQFDVATYLSYSWDKADWYAYNNGNINPNHLEASGKDSDGISFWYEENESRPISGIDLAAKWIWTGENFSSTMDKGALFRVKIPSSQKGPSPVVPEPGALSMLLIGIGNVALWRRRKEERCP